MAALKKIKPRIWKRNALIIILPCASFSLESQVIASLLSSPELM